MRLHRIALTDFRGVESSEVTFEAPGVTVVVGPNEIGKSSIAEALRLVREFKSSSQHSSIKSVQPTHPDVRPEVARELSTGPYRFIYTKRWIRRPMTELQLIQPRHEQLTGDQAHERVEQILDETMDADLWTALQQVQGESLQQASLARVMPLQSALSALADDTGASGTLHEDLLDRIEREFRRYHTATGKPTDVYAAAIRELADREAVVAEAEAALRAVDDVVDRHERLTLERARLEPKVGQAREQADDLAAREDAVGEVRREHDAAVARLSQAEVAVAAAQAAVEARAERVTEAQRRAELSTIAADEWLQAQERHREAVKQLAEFDAARGDVDGEVRTVRAQVVEAEQSVRAVQARDDAEVVRDRLAGIDAATRRIEQAEAELAENVVDADIVQQVADIQSRLHADRDAAAAGAARVVVERLGHAAVDIDGAPIDDDTATRELVDTTTVEVAGVVRVVVTPDDGAVRRRRKIEEREHELATVLAELGVADLAEARRRSGQRDDAERRAQAATVERDTLLAGESIESVRARVAASAAVAAAPDTTLDEARAVLADLVERLEQAQQTAAAGLHDREQLAARRVTANEHRLTAEARATGAVAELERATARLVADREAHSDEALAEALTGAEHTRAADAAALEIARSTLRAHDADSLDMLATNARELAKRLVGDLARLDADLAATTTELEVRGRDGLRDRLDTALARQADSRRVHDSLAARARAAQLLRSTMRRHRDSAQQRYVAPFRQAVESLGTLVFGPEFSVEIGDDLAIRSRTIGGVTVPFESLSGGAKEQLALIGRLATAQLVSADEGAPVILDDSLGFTDADRRRKLAAVINRVGSTSQIVILTCEPDRFSDIGSARIVRLG